MANTAKGIPEIAGTGFVKVGPTDINAALTAIDALLDVRAYAQVPTSQTTTSTSVTDLSTAGPSVTVTVPTNGILAIYASVTIDTITGPAGGARVDLVQDGSSLGQIISAGALLAATAFYILPGSSNGTTVTMFAGWLVLPPSATSHTYKLQYATVSSGTAAFSNRKIWARVLPF